MISAFVNINGNKANIRILSRKRFEEGLHALAGAAPGSIEISNNKLVTDSFKEFVKFFWSFWMCKSLKLVEIKTKRLFHRYNKEVKP